MKLFPARSRTKMGQLVCNEVETTVMRLSLYEAEPIDFASASVSAAMEGEEEGKKEEDEDEEGESDS
jgi:transcription elongation factor Elf1